MRARFTAVVLIAAVASCVVAACSGGVTQQSPQDARPTPKPAAADPAAPAAAMGPEAKLAFVRLRFAVTDTTGFTPMPAPGPHDWLAQHPEEHQTFHEYVDDDPVTATAERTHIAFLPVGPFDSEQQRIMETAVRFTEIWFELPTRTLETAPLPPMEFARDRGNGPQYLTGVFLKELLPNRLPDDAVCLVGVTMADIYPGRGWNFVFGQALLFQRVGVYSLARYFDAFYGGRDDAISLQMAKRRTCAVVVHELGHMFSLPHCVQHMCNMNGSNSLAETDSQPLHLCPGCLEKLQWNRGFDVVARYEKLLAFYEAEGFKKEAAWTRDRLARVNDAR